jgi:hypothetical protein
MESAAREKLRDNANQLAAGHAAEINFEADKQVDLMEICHKVYRATIDKKVSELTVSDSRAIKSCEALGYYWD